ncbi:MAG: GatB/YqeY domain-containing protein [Candidatus Krumholzibacteria bacterium]|jgi:hypothetical protein|nr:GatB/YqeY domain-containing protein [Candidatus Krumholzibacteria bacterium]MDP6669804.1 GatB/YqeY domain-containing protein [Candidatus Krumholzibacteria bacterium]MDP6796793.1 GatB/YqeY domain-containing protein [Candidatus Krumholzibacteria bacterium]MDP7022547.1 GatB/YqeY domain-containing protein [Candidatus Krumholzibacteria bacterium]
MNLDARLMEDLKTAMKKGDRLRTGVIRMLRSDLKYAHIEKGEDLDEAEGLEILARYARKRKEAAEEYRKGDRLDLAEKELAEEAFVKEYLPEALGEEEVRNIVDGVVSELDVSGMKHMGAVMTLVMLRTAGRAEGSLVSSLVKERLSS